MIYLYAHAGSGNHGCEAIVRATVKMLESPAVLATTAPEEDRRYGVEEAVTLLPDTPRQLGAVERLRHAVHFKLRHDDAVYIRLAHQDFFQSVHPGDICLSIGGDNYCYGGTDILGIYRRELQRRGAKTVLWGCSVEPSLLQDPAIAEDMRGYDLITARESITYQGLLEAGIRENVVLCADPAFQLDRVDLPLPEGFSPGNTVGINVSPLAASYGSGDLVVENYAALVALILNETGMQVALIPHVEKSGNEDRASLLTLYDRFRGTGRVLLVGDHNCMELKGFIGRCRFFVGARTHATIAAYSSCVPTLAAGYSVKARGIARDLFGTEEHYVVPVQGMDRRDDLARAFRWMLEHEEAIRIRLQETMPEYRARSFSAVHALCRLADMS
ncbi:polysaccharide pyruvyl transferase CsaB [uncultured Clostridium sp.]|nr:polysaccharide pyruvyl transferase CsaB [uncultured Clostridium sp.]